MNKTEFYTTAIKLIGVYLFIYSAYELISFGAFAFQPWPEDQYAYSILYMIYSILPIFLAVLIINKAQVLVRMLGLDNKNESEQHIEFGKWNSRAISELAFILLGGYLLLNNLVPFIVACIAFFADLVSVKYPYTNNPTDLRYSDQYNFIAGGISILMGYLILSNIKWFVAKITGERQIDSDV